MLNVIAGTAGGLKLKTTDSDKTKPTLGRVKEAMFSMIADYLPGATVLDLFAGSGSLGIEALSHGAEKCFFNDSNKSCCKITEQNLAFTKLISKATVSQYEFGMALDVYRKQKVVFDVVFLDPPYGMDYYSEVITGLQKRGLLRPNAIIIAEHTAERPLPEMRGLDIIKNKKYGTVAITVYLNRQ